MPSRDAAATTATPQLSPNAPRVRITAGLGSVNQKTWVLRRCATLIGSGRQSHIVLPNPEISRAHCLIVNTGTAVLLKDLSSQTGTRCRDEAADLVILSDGDVLRLGETVLQVAIQAVEQDPGASVSGMVLSDPLLLPEPVEVRLASSGESWQCQKAVTVIGRSARAEIRLDHPDVSLAHAAVFGCGRRIGIVDLDSRNGFSVNGEPRTLAVLASGDRLRLGPFDIDLRGAMTQRHAESLEASLVAAASDVAEQEDALSGNAERCNVELDRRSARLDREQRALEAARASIEKERAAVLRHAAALRETEASLEARRKSLEQREKTLRDTLLRQAQGVLAGVSPFIAAADPRSDTRLNAILPPN